TNIQSFLAGLIPFDSLPDTTLERLSEKFKLVRYRMGQPILVREKMPYQLAIIYEGRARLLGYDSQTKMPLTLQLLEPGEIIGWPGLIRQYSCETAIASTEVLCLTLPSADFLTLLDQEPQLANTFKTQPSIAEVFDVVSSELDSRADREATLKALNMANLKEFAQMAHRQAVIHYLPPGKTASEQLESDRFWFVSGGGTLKNASIGTRLSLDGNTPLEVPGTSPVRLVGLPKALLDIPESDPLVETPPSPPPELLDIPVVEAEILDAPPQPLDGELSPSSQQKKKTGPTRKYPFVKGKGPVNSALACFQMLSQYFGMPFRREVIQRVLNDQVRRTGTFSLQLGGAVAELMGLKVQLVNVPASAFTRLETPALIRWQESIALLYEVSDKELVIAVPEVGIVRRKPSEFLDSWGSEGQVLLIEPTKDTPQQKFGLNWFWPAIQRHRKVLLEVFVASFFVQLFGLANPLMIQIIIDKVIVQKSIDTLHILGIFLVVIAVFEALLSSLRTYLFVDTTNRIDMSLGSEIIDHLLRLPLRYFEKRPVGELSSRVNELENIRSFLTGTGLTVVLDAVFSVIYIVVMFIYSWVLTLVAMATIPLFVLLSIFVSPIVRRQLRVKAERNAQTQSFLVEALSGIQTVKAQNIELRSRWQWQERYARYVSAGFKTVITSTTASSASNFLNKLSALLVLWVGAYLVLQGDLTLGQLIAFRIISSYVTSPLLRLAQLWQNFQETALSLERLSDIVDHPQEADESDKDNIPMPIVKGLVKFENVSFRFGTAGPYQLTNINLEFEPGEFVGIVGQSGSGKSTLMKLLPRLYEPDSGRIFIENYDISKVELYSLRRQIGIVPQDSLLFDGTVRDNIALTNPDATSDEIVEAAKIACAHDFIMGLPNGYNSRVGERGSALSGGQRQRIAIARTILQNPNLLILDEATSALDYDTERRLCENLKEAFRDRTVFFITHRLSTIRSADRILMMANGAAVEQGSHEDLIAMQGRYYCLYQQQEAQV
ncbi:MAG: peptidase domain-containing ABC transporter, partial [Cyanobacteriota bacterium]